jgi:glycosyltransferase involved in cell wall biosynthesis
MISVCIPTYEQRGSGQKYLRELLDSIVRQRKAEFEVVISDNSRDDKLEILCQPYAGRLRLNYVRNNDTFGVSNNTNNAIAHAQSDYIKIMYQDDLLVSDFALRSFDKAVHRRAWAVSSYWSMDEHSRFRQKHKPILGADILFGKNTLGMPSVLAMRRNGLAFDPNLRTRLDCEYYWLLDQEYGPPEYIQDTLVALRYWNGSISRVQGNLSDQENIYLRAKHEQVLTSGNESMIELKRKGNPRISDKDIYVTSDGTLVDRGDRRAAWKVVAKGGVITQQMIDRYGLDNPKPQPPEVPVDATEKPKKRQKRIIKPTSTR